MEDYLPYLMIFGAALYFLPSILSFSYFILVSVVALTVGALFGFKGLSLCALCIGSIAAFLLALIIIMIPFDLLSKHLESFKHKKEI
mgnify:CR=1|jgi:uncharacterized membrane protein YdjX (TVP38/TMEM64 family)